MLGAELLWLLPILLFAVMLLLVVIGTPVAFALVLTSMSIVTLDPRLQMWTVFQRMFNGMNSFVLLAIPLFLLAGNLMNNANITSRLITLARHLVGHIKGALAHVNVLVSMLFAGVSGSSTADSAGIGTVLIPAMVKQGYPKALSVSVTAASSVMGIIIPPSINMIVWGALTNTSVAAMFLGGFIPGVMIAGGQMALNVFLVKKYDVPVYRRSTLKEIFTSGRDGMLAAGIPIIIIGGLVAGIVSPTEAAVTAVLYSLILGVFVYKDLDTRKIIKSGRDTVKLSSLSLFSLVAASVFGYLISFYKIPDLLLQNMPAQNTTALLLVMVFVMLVIGTFMDALPAMAILAPLFMPLVRAAGIHPVHFGLIAVMALGLGLVTPPYGLCLMISAKIGNISMVRAFRTTLAYLAIMLVIIVIIVLLPDTVMLLPRLLVPDFI